MKNILKFIAATLIVTAVIGTLYSNHKRHNGWINNREVITITVQYGDTLDGYWVEYAPHWMGREEYRAEIMSLNNMDSAMIYANQTIDVYTYCEHYTVQGWCWYDTITTVDGNVWGYDNNTNGCAYVTFSDNGTADNIYDDVIISVEYIQ